MSRFSKIRFRRPKRLTVLLLLSFLFHGALLWNGSRDYEPYDFSKGAPIEITEAPADSLPPRKQIEKQQLTPRKRPEVAETEKADNDKLDPNAQFLSERNQTAQQEMKAKQIDDYRKKEGTGLKNSLSQEKVPPPTGNPQETAKADGLSTAPDANKKTAGVKRNWKSLTLKDLGLGGDGGMVASTDDHLDGVATGDRTVLSTREFKFYSYYHRIKETLRQYWKPNVERKLAVLWSRGAKMNDGELVTQVIVMLNQGGSVTRITRVTSSGFEDLDNAAIEAFHQASPFPNPPAGMRDPDGLVRIRWDFILKTEASPQITFRGAGRRMP